MSPAQYSIAPLLEVRNLSVRFHEHRHLAVDRVSFRMSRGHSLGLVGASGAGKSSIARAILHLEKPDSGQILFKGKNIARMNSQQLRVARQSMQLVFQEPSTSLSPRRSIESTLLEPLQHFAIGDKQYRYQKIQQTLQTVGLDQDVLKRYPHQFSNGQQQRIAFARALVADPELLIADEAVSSLDVSVQAQILQLIRRLQKDHGITFLFISHDLAVIRQIADDVAVTYRGQMVEQSPADSFFSQPAHPYSKALLSFASSETPVHIQDNQWRLDRGRMAGENCPACVFAPNCPDKMPVCDELEPVEQELQSNNQPIEGRHCVKCHIYNEVNTDEI